MLENRLLPWYFLVFTDESDDDENNEDDGDEGEDGEDGTWVFLRLIFRKRVCKRLDLECFLVGFL